MEELQSNRSEGVIFKKSALVSAFQSALDGLDMECSTSDDESFEYNNSRNDPDVMEAMPENLRIDIDSIFKEFLSNVEETEYIFPSNLNNLQRKYIHEKARSMNIISKSYGNPPNRKLHIKKKPRNSSCHSYGITPCEASATAITHFLRNNYREDHAQSSYQDFRHSRHNDCSDKVFSKLVDIPPPKVMRPKISQEILKFKLKLPVTHLRDDIINKITTNQVLIVCSETGSGKTTQIPQFIMEECEARNLPCKIICTQPRRISTVSVAERVSEERGDRLGESVGYHIRLEQRYGISTNLIYCTNGIMLRSLMSGNKILKNITHIIIDEVHERDRLSDFLLICLKNNLKLFPNLKIILMSATINIDKFKNYFGTEADVLSLRGRSYPIEEYFLDDILLNLEYMSPKMALMKARGGDQETTIPTICEYKNDAMDQALEEYLDCDGDILGPSAQLAVYFLSEGISVDYQHSLTGMTALMVAAYHGDTELLSQIINLGADVNVRCQKGKTALDYAMENHQETAFNVLKYYTCGKPDDTQSKSESLLRLYDKSVSDEEIDFDLILEIVKHVHGVNSPGAILVFLPGYDDIMLCNDYIVNSDLDKKSYRVFFLHGSMNIREQHEVFKHIPNKRKIILSTNIAETSLTIDDVVYVIDTGKAKEKAFDSYNKMSSLQTQWISKACVKQRAGRAGRVQPGICFHLFSHQRYNNMDEERVPEILRVSLEELCLHTKILAPRNMQIFTFLELALDPPSANSVKAAIESLQALGALDEEENLTKLGQYLSQLTIEPRLGKMLIYSVVFRCLEPILTLSATLAHKDPFQLPPQAQLKTAAAERRKSLTQDVPSDHLIFLRAFIKWQEDSQKGRGPEFCREFFISKSTMESILETRRQLLGQLRAAGFIPQANSIQEFNKYAENWPLVKSVIALGLYPNVAFPASSGSYSTKNEKKVYVPNTSVLNRQKLNAWMVFDELNKNRQNYVIRGLTAVTPLTVALTCGNKSSPSTSTSFAIDDWLEFESVNDSVFRFREAIQGLVQKVLQHPSYSYRPGDVKTVDVLQFALFQEDKSENLPQAKGIGHKPAFLHTLNGRNRYLPPPTDFSPSSSSGRPFESAGAAYSPSSSQGGRPTYDSPGGFSVAPQQSSSGYRARRQDQNYQNGGGGCGDMRNMYLRFDGLGFSYNNGHERLRGGGDDYRLRQVPDDTIYLLIKPKQVNSVSIAFQKMTWVFSPQTEKKIKFYHRAGKPIYLIFTVVNSHCFQGLAFFKSIHTDRNFGKPTATIDWIFKTDLSHNKIRHLRNPYNAERPIFEGPDGQLIEQNVAEELCRIYTQVTAPGPNRH